MKKILIDVLGGDNNKLQFMDAIIKNASIFNNYEFVVFLDENTANLTYNYGNNVKFVICNKAISNSDNPMNMMNDNESSMARALNELKSDDKAIGLISSGSTGSLLVGSITKVGCIEGLKFPVLGCLLLTITGKYFCLVDCGANLDISANKVIQFSKLGSAFLTSLFDVENPRIGLLNIGREPGKGNAFSKEAYKILAESELNFVGNVEAADPFLDKVDVLVSDGFSGNIFLKNSEAVSMINRDIALKNNDIQTAEEIYKLFAYTDLGSAYVLGSKKPILKMHGGSNGESISSAIKNLIELDNKKYIEKLKENIENI